MFAHAFIKLVLFGDNILYILCFRTERPRLAIISSNKTHCDNYCCVLLVGNVMNDNNHTTIMNNIQLGDDRENQE